MLPRLYHLLWKLARPLLRRHHRLREGFDQRLIPPSWPAGTGSSWSGCRLWLHGASGGEAYLVRELVKELAADPRIGPSLLCTCMTSQGMEILRQTQREFQGNGLTLHTAYLPLDDLSLTRRAVRQAFGPAPQGAVLALLETELWPGLLQACRENGVSVLILNGRLTPQSLRAYRPLRSFLRRLAPDRILAVSPEDRDRFARLFGSQTPCDLMPNIKFDRVCPLPDTVSPLQPPLIALASVREEEEKILIPCLAALRLEAPHCVLALAPRHLHRLKAWEKHLRNLGALPVRASQIQSPPLPGQILLWDSFGTLSQLYAMARAVFVGGSLAPLGGQNFLEPLSHGLMPCVGPFWSNFTWIGEEIFTLGLAHRVYDAEDLARSLLDQERKAPEKSLIKKRLAAYLASRQGGARLAAAMVAQFL